MFHTLGAIAVGVVGMIFFGVSIYAFKNVSNRLILNFAAMTLGMALFSIGYCAELFSKTFVSGYLGN